jgi:hypothetical protein
MKRTILLLIIIFQIVVVIIGCKSDNVDKGDTGEKFFKNDQNLYFPIAKGNTWKYLSTLVDGDSIIIKVKDFIKVKNKWYAELEKNHYSHLGGIYSTSTKYWSYGDSGKVICYDSLEEITSLHNKENAQIYYYTQVDSGTQWRSGIRETAYIQFKKSYDSKTINCIHFQSCLMYHIIGDGGHRDEYIAKGIGLIKTYPLMLYSYKVDGKEFSNLHPFIEKEGPVSF